MGALTSGFLAARGVRFSSSFTATLPNDLLNTLRAIPHCRLPRARSHDGGIIGKMANETDHNAGETP
jgi:hypothetical protein